MNGVLTFASGTVVFALIALALASTPLWIIVAIVVALGIVVSGGDLETPYQQLHRRREEEELYQYEYREAKLAELETSLPTLVEIETAPEKPDILETQARSELMKDLTTIGVNTYTLKYMSDEEIYKSLDKTDTINLRELRRFMQDGK